MATAHKTAPDAIPTPDQQVEWQRDYLRWAEGLAQRSCGPRGVEFAGVALAQAISTFDGTTPFRAWASRKIPWVIKSQLASLYRSGDVQLSDEMVAIGLGGIAEPARDQPQTADIVDALRGLDLLGGQDRAESIGAALGQFTKREVARITSPRWMPDWQSVEEVVDACLLFGGSLWSTRPGKGSPAIEFSRKLGNTQAMAWMIIVLEQTFPELIRFSVKAGEDSLEKYGRIIYRTAPHFALKPSLARWTPRKRRTPGDVVSDSTLAVWIASGLYEAGEGETVKLKAPHLTVETAQPIGQQILSRGIGCTVSVERGRGQNAKALIAVDPLHRPAAEQWTAQRVPRFVWKWR